MAKTKNWRYKDKLYIDDVADEMEESIELMYSSKTPEHYYLTLNSGHPLDSYGVNWEKSSECVALSKPQVQLLIKKLENLISDDKGKFVLYGEIHEE